MVDLKKESGEQKEGYCGLSMRTTKPFFLYLYLFLMISGFLVFPGGKFRQPHKILNSDILRHFQPKDLLQRVLDAFGRKKNGFFLCKTQDNS